MSTTPFRSVAQRWADHAGNAGGFAGLDPTLRKALLLAFHAGFVSALQACDEAVLNRTPSDAALLVESLRIEVSTSLARATHLPTDESIQ